MYWILFVMAAIAAVIVAVIVGGLVTPRDHAVARTVRVPAAPGDVWHTVRNVGAYSDWRHEIEHAEVIDADQPQVRWRETSTRGSVSFGVTREDAPHTMSARILDDDLPFTGEWTWHVAADGTGTRVAITERGSVSNPVFRFIGAHFIGYTKSIDAYLSALAAHHGAPRAAIADAPVRDAAGA